MSFVLEDGTGIVGANAYISVAYADQYFLDRGVVAWTGTNAEKQAWIIRATDYIESRFEGRFLNAPLTTVQSLSFPRTIYSPSMPERLKKATAEYALRAKTATLLPDPIVSASGGSVSAESVTVGPISKSTSYATSGSKTVIRPYPAADRLMSSLVCGITQGSVYR